MVTTSHGGHRPPSRPGPPRSSASSQRPASGTASTSGVEQQPVAPRLPLDHRGVQQHGGQHHHGVRPQRPRSIGADPAGSGQRDHRAEQRQRPGQRECHPVLVRIPGRHREDLPAEGDRPVLRVHADRPAAAMIASAAARAQRGQRGVERGVPDPQRVDQHRRRIVPLHRDGLAEVDLLIATASVPDFPAALGQRLGITQARIASLTDGFGGAHTAAAAIAREPVLPAPGTSRTALVVSAGAGITVVAALHRL